MALISLSISDLFLKTFGYESPAFNAQDARTATPLDKQVTLSGHAYEEYEARVPSTLLGSPYWDIDDFGREYFMPVTLGGMKLPYPVLSVRGSKRIVDTPLVEREGEVEELIAIQSYNVIIRGVIVTKDAFPEKVVGQLSDLYRRNEALEIINPITERWLPLNTLGKRMVTIRAVDFPETRGVMGVRGYQLELKSSLDFNLLEI